MVREENTVEERVWEERVWLFVENAMKWNVMLCCDEKGWCCIVVRSVTTRNEFPLSINHTHPQLQLNEKKNYTLHTPSSTLLIPSSPLSISSHCPTHISLYPFPHNPSWNQPSTPHSRNTHHFLKSSKQLIYPSLSWKVDCICIV